MIFANRIEAGKLLAKRLHKLKLSKNTLIVGIPRGGMVVAREVAQKLSLPLGVIVVKKLGAMHNPELAIGAVASHGEPVLDRWLIRDLGTPKDYIKKEILKKRKEAKSREKLLGIDDKAEIFRGRDVVVIDDGLATGQTARAAAKILRQLGAKTLILAVPACFPSTLESVEGDFDQVLCLEMSPDFEAVGQFYRDFRPVSDEEVKQLLATSH